jgi:S-adenosylmethionine-diacylglycerol 3-amino-3-carboxypropyl transferase
VQAAELPLAFAQVQEDPTIDLICKTQANARVAMFASGGCTAAALGVHDVTASITCIDLNPAQIALTRHKVALLNSEPGERLDKETVQAVTWCE